MPNNLETKSLHGKYISAGFDAIGMAENEHLPETLTRIMVELARGVYTDMRIVPGDVALEGSGLKLVEPSQHIIYAKDNTEHPNYPQGIRRVQAELIDIEADEYTLLPLNLIK